jgi:hypothetical protein
MHTITRVARPNTPEGFRFSGSALEHGWVWVGRMPGWPFDSSISRSARRYACSPVAAVSSSATSSCWLCGMRSWCSVAVHRDRGCAGQTERSSRRSLGPHRAKGRPATQPGLRGALRRYGASHAIVYGVISAAAPLIVVGTTALGIAAGRADWPQFEGALAVVLAGVAAAFVGRSGACLELAQGRRVTPNRAAEPEPNEQ